MADWTKEPMERVEGEVIQPTPDQEHQQTRGATTPAGNAIEGEKKEGIFTRFVVKPVKAVGRCIRGASTTTKVVVAGAIGLGAGYAIHKFIGDDRDDDTIDLTISLPVSVLNEDQTALADNAVVDIPEIPETDTDEIDEAVGRMSDAVEQIIAPATEAVTMDVTE